MNSPTICSVLARTIVRTLSPMLICRDMRSTVVSHDSVVSCPHHVVRTRAGAPLTRQRGPAGDTITPSLVTLLLGRHHPVQPFTGSRTQETPRDTRRHQGIPVVTRRHQGIPADTRGYQETSGDTPRNTRGHHRTAGLLLSPVVRSIRRLAGQDCLLSPVTPSHCQTAVQRNSGNAPVLALLWTPTVGNLNAKPHAVKTYLVLGQTFTFYLLLKRKSFKTI